MNARHLATMLAVLTCLAAPAIVEGKAALPSSPGQVRPLMVGAPLPAVQLKTAAGEDFDLGSALAAKPTILVLYRGGW